MAKKFVWIVVLIFFVISFSSISYSNYFENSINLEIDVAPYTDVNVTAEELFSDPLEGKEGLYISDGNQVKSYAKNLWNLEENDIVQHESNVSGILFNIRSNQDLQITVSSDFGWGVNSPAAFLVFEHWAPYNHRLSIYSSDGSGDSIKNASFIHGADETGTQYKIGGAIFIENIYDQSAGTYTTTVNITVEQT